LQKISVFLHHVENLTERNRNDLGSLQGNGTVPPLLPGSAKLPHNIAWFANIVNELVPVASDAPDLHEPILDEEKRPAFIPYVVDYLVSFEDGHAAVPQGDITKLSSEHRSQYR
jgi:hypothetical protein